MIMYGRQCAVRPRPAALRRAARIPAAFGIAVALTTFGVTAEPAGTPPGAFQPADISIGEPAPLPFPAATPDRDGGVSILQPAPAPGRGWLGLAVAESTVPGRWTVEEVVANGPAARAGILTGDEVRAINGAVLGSADEVSQVLTSIRPGQQVRIAIARQEQVTDLQLTAENRPTQAASRTWESAGSRPAGRLASGELPLTPPTPRSPAAARQPPPSVAPPDPSAAAAWTGQVPDAPAGPAAARFAQPPAPLQPATVPGPPATSPLPGTSALLPAPLPPAALPRGSAVPTAPALGTAGPQGRPALGVRTLPVDGATQVRLRLPGTAGAYVTSVVHDLPAAKAGLVPGSVITALDERAVGSPADLAGMVATAPVDRPVTVQFVLPDGRERRTQIVLEPLPAPLERALVGGTGGGDAGQPSGPRRTRRPFVGAEPLERLREEARQLRRRLEQLERRLEGADPDAR